MCPTHSEAIKIQLLLKNEVVMYYSVLPLPPPLSVFLPVPILFPVLSRYVVFG